MITNPEDIKKIQETLDELQKSLGIEDDPSFDSSEYDFSFLKDKYGLDMEELEKNLMKPTETKIGFSVQKIHEDAVLPKYNYQTDSGFDFYSVEDVIIGPFGRALVPTGLKFDLPTNVELQVRSKSGLAIKDGIMVLNSPGTVDNGYTGEVQVIIFNTNSEPYTIKKGMKIAQGVLSYVINGGVVSMTEVNKIQEKDRNANGFGSTGR
jgi:dUTP pyrophosphatase